jgi:hypothetical protein
MSNASQLLARAREAERHRLAEGVDEKLAPEPARLDERNASGSQGSRAHEADLASVHRLATWMDNRFVIPGTGIRFGLDSVLGLIPGLGDTLTLAPSLYIVAIARKLEAPTWVTARMLANIGLDWLIGLVPLLGDILDVRFKANSRNAELLQAHLDRRNRDATG